ncbi:Gfo/Idh/MocA family oxidoreductase [Pelagicoccus sp. NFK12]|uniref:Gfo/Idh/MocA family oxidoreductase n=1 Tax=Pelagicoccus enzymogenes TaxID=2773457 RepID=A0A927FA69_9BACT|nr:Gfo/Idh/MocA family oxidoreductase [Pelagicoccus enzymogenes]MBD5779733.1 Gfo/Idh/MocA family oxidoreductase [Pelagicoccus enzymogenes]MDQ8200231.1 Gfo/Idh/MocA family oxidoreductase [Pelagicoccus enzymogenes]
MKVHKIGIIMNGVTGRMGKNQHLLRSIVEIIKQGGVHVSPTEFIMPDPILVGRNEVKLKELCELTGIEKYTTDLDSVMSDPAYPIYFDAQTTLRRADAVKAAATAGKHVYCEKPTAIDTETALDLFKFCEEKGVKNGVVQDKLWLPGLVKLQRAIQNGYLGRIVSVTGDFGYWVFEGDTVPAQRPSWNYRKEDGGGMIIDMLCHWRYVLDNIFGPVKSVQCRGATHIKERVDEQGKTYKCTADDAAYAMFEIDGPDGEIIVNFNSSWVTRVRRDDLLTLHVDGEKGSAVAGLRDCYIQHYSNTPKPVWNPDIDQPINFYDDWSKVPDQEVYDNAFKVQWEMFLKHVVLDEPFRWTLLEGAKGVQLAELGIKSWEERKWVDLVDLA